MCRISHITLVILLMIFASACAGDIATPLPTSLPVTEPIPDCILDVQPAPASRVSFEWYQANLNDDSIYEGYRPVSELGHKSNVCVYLDFGPLIQSGDELISNEEYFNRVALYVDSKKLEPKPDEQLAYLEGLLLYPEIGPGTVSGMPYWFCWPAPLEVGVHRATFQFRQTDGTLFEFSWSFEITVN